MKNILSKASEAATLQFGMFSLVDIGLWLLLYESQIIMSSGHVSEKYEKIPSFQTQSCRNISAIN